MTEVIGVTKVTKATRLNEVNEVTLVTWVTLVTRVTRTSTRTKVLEVGPRDGSLLWSGNVMSGLVWSGMSYLISLNPLLFKNKAHIGSFEHFVFVFVFVLKWTVGVEISKGHLSIYTSTQGT